jgi:hypothetical protein
LIAHKLAIEAHADVIGEQSSEDGPSLKTILALLHYEIASSHCIQQWSAAKLYNFFDFAQPEPTDAGPHATGWRCTVEGARLGNLALRAQDRVVRGALALQRLYTLIGDGNGDGTWTWARPDWLDAFPEMTPENLAKANAAQKAADERRKREAEEAAKHPKLHRSPGQRRGHLKNGNPAGDYLAAPRCGAHTRTGHSCRQPAMASPGGSRGRCRFHGGLSTGPRTAEGLRNSRTARLIHGGRTAEIIDLRSAAARSARRMKLLLATARSATSPAGHGVDRSVSSSSLESATLNHRDTACLGEAEAASFRRSQEAQRDRVARIIPLNQAKAFIARAKPAQNPFKAPLLAATSPQHLRSSAFICGSKPSSRRSALLASTAAFTSPLRVSVPLWFKAGSSAPAGHGLHRSLRRAA